MANSRVLALSSSRVGSGAYLEAAAPIIGQFLGKEGLKIVFIPFAGVATTPADYAENVRAGLASLNCTIDVVLPENAKATIQKADVIMVGGGNTFKLLADLYKAKLLDTIRDKVDAGTPFIGWSAGANITGPTICTTNDMPIVEPPSFNALGLLPFQLNPHYFNQAIAGHNGETRDQRLTEFLIMNPGVPIVCLPEGTALKREGDKLELLGICPAILLELEDEEANTISRKELAVGADLSFLL